MPKAKKIQKVSWKTEAERKLILKQTIMEINKTQGMDCIHLAKDEKEWEKIPFGIPEIDNLIGGIPCGHFSVFWGREGCGKSTMSYYLIAQAQSRGKIVYLIDLENSYEAKRAQQFGVNVENLIVGHFPIAEQSLDSIVTFARKKIADVIILDSVHSLSPKTEQQTKSGEQKSSDKDNMAILARRLSPWFRVAIDPVKRANIAVMLIAQSRFGVGLFGIEQLTGGQALKQYSVLTVRVKKGKLTDAPKEKIKKVVMDEEGEEKIKSLLKVVGFDCVVKIDKTQTPGTKSELTKIHLPFYFSSGFSKETMYPPTVPESKMLEKQRMNNHQLKRNEAEPERRNDETSG